MQSIVISGNIGKDADLRQTQGGDDVLSFNVGSKQGYGDNASTNWFRCSLWGKRGRSLQQYLTKGTKVVVNGEFSTSEYEGKTQLNVRVGEVEFMSKGGQSGDTRTGSGSVQGGGGMQAGGFGDDLEDDVPFASSSFLAGLRAS